MLAVVSFFWVDEARKRSRRVGLTPEDVRIWDRMVARHLKTPHTRSCVTHRPDLIPFMATYPLDMAKHVPGTCCVKLQAHDPAFARAIGADRIVLMDIDCVVTAPLDPLFDRVLLGLGQVGRSIQRHLLAHRRIAHGDLLEQQAATRLTGDHDAPTAAAFLQLRKRGQTEVLRRT